MEARLRIKFRVALPITLTVVCGACTTLQNQSRVDPRTVAVYSDEVDCAAARIKGDTFAGALNPKCLKDSDKITFYEAALINKLARNRLAERLIKRSNEVCIVEMGRLTGNEAMVNTILSTATTGLTAAGSVVVGDWNRVLSAAATFTNGTRDHIRAEVYRNFVTYQLIKAIGIERAKRLEAIKKHDGETPNQYNVDEMIREIDEYHQICSFYIGLTLVDAAVSKSAVPASTRVDDLSAAINELESRVSTLNAQLANPNLAEGFKNGITTQRDALLTQQTELFKQRATLRTGTRQPSTTQTQQGNSSSGEG